MPVRSHHRSVQTTLVITQSVGDTIFCIVGLCTALWLRFFSPLRSIGYVLESAERNFADYVPLLALGTVLLLGTFFYLNLYDSRLLLRPHRVFAIILKGMFFWVCVFLGTSLAMKFEPPISRLFVFFSCGTTLLLLSLWRYGFYAYVSRSSYREDILLRVALLGWSDEAAKLTEAIAQDGNHPYEVVGAIAVGPGPGTSPLNRIPLACLGSTEDLAAALDAHAVDILVVAELDLPREQLESVATTCERCYVAFKIIPSFFQIFVSSLRLQTISGVSILGVESLPLEYFPHRILKRALDVAGAMAGLVLAAPVIAVLAILIRRESRGPVFFAQERVGYGGRPFRMWKLRSMVAGAHLRDNESQSTLRLDERITRIGKFMRQNNLDELPQFWNVLCGDMSLIGPRPERSYHVAQLSSHIPHYNPRHTVRPGMSGWAQVNGLRGDTSLVERVKYDLYYIENWSIWLDIQIMLLTFVRLKNAY